MNKQFKPSGYNSVSPYFIINDAEKFIALLNEIFGAKQLRRFDNPDGSVMHAEVLIDDSVIMVGNANEKWPPVAIVMHVYVEDVDAVFRKAIDAGCEAIEKPVTRDGDPDKRGTFKDYGGNMWSVGSQQ